jgi:hypothetical protein
MEVLLLCVLYGYYTKGLYFWCRWRSQCDYYRHYGRDALPFRSYFPWPFLAAELPDIGHVEPLLVDAAVPTVRRSDGALDELPLLALYWLMPADDAHMIVASWRMLREANGGDPNIF